MGEGRTEGGRVNGSMQSFIFYCALTLHILYLIQCQCYIIVHGTATNFFIAFVKASEISYV